MPVILDFHIKSKKKNNYSLEVFKRGNSQPLASSTFDYDLSYITQFEINQLEPDAKDPHGRMERLKEFGKKLYDKLFMPDVQKLWADFKQKSDFLILCLRLAPEAHGLEVLPWEALYNGDEFIAAGAKTGLSRLPLDVEIQDDLPALPLPLKMLALVSSPLDLKENERLQIEKEQEILLQAVNTPAGQGKLTLEPEDEAKLQVIESSLESGYQILHYSGHGIPPEDGGGLLLEDSQGNKRPTPVTEFLQTMQKAEKDLRLTVISGCQTARTLHIAGFRDLARGLLRRKIPAVIAMQFSISDVAGLKFAETLYPRLIEGQMLDMAVSASHRALLQNDDVRIQTDAFAPVLFVSNSRPLQTKPAETTQAAVQPKIDFSFHLPLPQLQFGFYGRRKEYRAIRDGLLHKNHRAIIVHGIGGIGKTALISHTATRLREHFKGIYAFDCTSSALAPETILLELHRYLERQGITTLQQLLHQSFPPDQLATFIAQVLSQLSLLLIFDNFETLLVPEGTTHKIANENLAIFLKTLIKTTAAGTRFLFTTRYLFDLDTKRIGTIAELPLGDLSRPEALGLMQKLPYLSGASFDDKMRAFDTFGGHPYALVTLDRHCGHRPLADVLNDATNVHAELREFLAIELSYAKLSDCSRELLNRLAAFRKPVSTDAAEWVMGKKVELTTDFIKKLDRKEMPEKLKSMNDEELLNAFQKLLPEKRQADVDKEITELIGWGLLTPIEVDGEVRALAVHSLVRDFCRDKLPSDDWKRNLRDAAAFYTNQTKLLRRDEKSPAAIWTEMESFELLFEAEDFEPAASLLIKATPLLDRWGFGRSLESSCRRLMPKVTTNLQAMLLHILGILLQGRGDYDAALTEYTESLKVYENLTDLKNVSNALHQIGNIHYLRGDYDQALQQYEKSQKIDKELGKRAGISKSLHQIGMIHQDRGDYDKALQYYEKSLKIAEELGDRADVARSHGQMGNLCQLQKNYKDAVKHYEEALEVFEELGDRAGLSASLHNIGAIHQAHGDYDKAIQLYEKSLKILEELGDLAGVSKSLHQIAIIHQERGDYDQALQQYEKSLKIFEELGGRFGIALSHGQMGQLFMETKRYPQAVEHLLLALFIFTEMQSPNAPKVGNALKKLRALWGAKNFDKAWREKTGRDVPDWLKENPKKTTKTKKKKNTTRTAKKKTKKKTAKPAIAKKTVAPKKTPKTKKRKNK